MPKLNPNPMSDRATLSLLIERARQNLEPTIEYRASWLKKGGIGSSEWEVVGPNRSTAIVSFAEPLPDGTLLTDTVNKLILTTIQKHVFCIRAGYLSPQVDHRAWAKYVRFFINITSWQFLFKERYHPQSKGFKLINENACEVIIESYKKCGWAGVLQIIPRLSEYFCTLIDEEYDGEKLTEQQISKTIKHLKENCLYVKKGNIRNGTTGLVSRDYLAKAINTHASAFNHDTVRISLRQFEESLQQPILVQGVLTRAQYKSHKTAIINHEQNGGITRKSLIQFLNLMKLLSEGNPYLPDTIPSFKFDPAEHMNKQDVRIDGHTRKIPYSIGIYALGKAVEWIMVYGKAIVGATVATVMAFKNIPPEELKGRSHRYRQRQEIFEDIISQYSTESFEGLPAQPLAAALHITKLTSHSHAESTSTNMTFAVALECFVAACAIVIGFTKPIRVNELAHIQRDALSYQTNDEGAFLAHPILKRRVPIPPTIRRPIPYIAAVAAQLLAVLGNGLKEVYEDTSPHSEHLFYFPSSKGFNQPSGKGIDARIDYAMRSFCDIIEIPVDIYGRRWYIKIHEMRKFFIFTMYNHAKVYTDDAIRHHAGHDDPRYLHDYLSGEVPEEEIIRYNIENIEDKLINLEIGNINESENQGLVALYKQILSTMKITSLKSRNKYEFDQILQALLATDGLLISVYTIRLTTYDSEVFDTEIALKYGEAADEKFNR
ncbi:hypothetical protein [Pseudomonas tremae]|uniref:hypothetical protein n=1 Tax=Pseudomonas tremae TaxID=200454 RepID=UPI001F404079|nr:hypothetical protein [Pseudomonas tremae]MCF5804905.1 hypothetical protein [Pseudomonas tremae]MCF5811581.1 hypothetical protein [Pseudomonas tremae]